MKKNEITLPVTPDQFDKLIKTLVKKYKLPDEKHAVVVVANRIMHLPPDQIKTTLDYLGHSVLKNIAYQIAQAKAKEVTHKDEVNHLVSLITSNPHDNQPMDELEKIAGQGSKYAKEKLEEIRSIGAA